MIMQKTILSTLAKHSPMTSVSTLLLIAISYNAVAHTHTPATPITFAQGKISATVSGELSPKQNEHWYQFEARSSQYAIINLSALAGSAETANVGVLHMPNGEQDGNKGGIIYQGCLPTNGTYRLRIARNLMATQGQTAGYNADIIVLPKYASASLCE